MYRWMSGLWFMSYERCYVMMSRLGWVLFLLFGKDGSWVCIRARDG
jgi:hypothetical protein